MKIKELECQFDDFLFVISEKRLVIKSILR